MKDSQDLYYKKRKVIERYFSSGKQSRLLNSVLNLTKDKVTAHVGMSEMTYLATMLARLEHDHIDNLRQMRLSVRSLNYPVPSHLWQFSD